MSLSFEAGWLIYISFRRRRACGFIVPAFPAGDLLSSARGHQMQMLRWYARTDLTGEPGYEAQAHAAKRVTSTAGLGIWTRASASFDFRPFASRSFTQQPRTQRARPITVEFSGSRAHARLASAPPSFLSTWPRAGDHPPVRKSL